jgi:hypothetical protein
MFEHQNMRWITTAMEIMAERAGHVGGHHAGSAIRRRSE